MKSALKLTIFAALIAVFVAAPAITAESLRITSDLENEAASFSVDKNIANETVLSLDVSAVEISTISLNSKDYKKVKLPTAKFLFESELAEDGMPDLPAITTNIAVPDMAGIEFTVSYESYEIIENIEIAPTQPPMLESGMEIPPFTINSDMYNSDEFYPGEIAEVHDPVILRDVRMVQVTMYPVQYNPAKKQLKIYRNMQVSLSYDGENVVNPKNARHEFISEAFLPLYQSMIPNFDDLYSTLDVRRGGILILAKDMFVDTLRAFANWKHRKGYDVYIAPTTEIAPPNGNPSQSQVYNYIKNAYDNWEIPPEYVMIVGDEDNTSYTGIPDYPYSYYASDHSYTEVDGNDFLPDVFLARFSVDNMSQLRIALAKAMDYETNPYMEDPNHWRRGLSVAGNVYATTPRITTLWVRSLLLEFGFTQVDTSFRWGSGQSDPNLLGYFNSGPCLISYRGWAGSSGWYSPTFNTGNLSQIQNHNKLAIMASIVCGTCDFGSPECFGEKWIRMGSSTTSYKGGPAVWGSTDHSTHTRWNNPLMTGYYWGIFKENNYHFAAAAVRGKIQQYNTFPRHVSPGGNIEKYFHTYNMLGDPEISVRTKPPIMLSVTRPSSINLGLNHIFVNVLNNVEHPVEGAYVTLYKEIGGQEELWVVGKTDANGDITFTFDAPSAGDMMLTVSGRDLFPYQGTIEIISGDVAVGYDTHLIDDDNTGYSSGNNNGIANPGEIIELSVDLENYGTGSTAYSVTATIEAVDENLATILNPEGEFGDIAAGQSATCTAPFVVQINAGAQDGDMARVKITATDSNNNSWESAIELAVEAPKLRVSAVVFAGGNGRLDPGETLNMTITVENIGTVDAANVTASVSTMDDFTSLPNNTCSFGDIAAGGFADNSSNPLIISSDAESFDGHTINLMLHTLTSSGAMVDIPFTVTVGQVLATDPTGPDAYGYYMFDNSDADYTPSPIYSWAEIVPNLGGQGTRMLFVGGTDDGSNIISLPFDFVYYGEPYGALLVCTNGFAALDTFAYDMGGNRWFNFYNWPIPDPGNARGQLSPFWDDLSYSGGTDGVYTWYDTNNHRFIIQWQHMRHQNTFAYNTFQMIITDPAYHPTMTGDSEIIYQYKTISNNDSDEHYSSVGFESWDELMGLEYTYDNFYKPGAATLGNSKAIKITTNTGRGGIKGMAGTGGVTVSTSGGRYRVTEEDGSYWIKNVPPGAVDLSVDKDGYFPVVMAGVNVSANVTTANVDFDMVQCPVPGNLDASEGLGDRIELTWSAVSHADLDGYNIYRADWESSEYAKLNSSPVSIASYTDDTIADNGTYWYYIKAAYSGSYGEIESVPSNIAYGSTDVVTDIDDENPAIPQNFFISQNYPNPFNPVTTISYGLPKDADVRIDIFNVLGQRVIALIDGPQSAGYKSIVWNGMDSGGNKVSSGIYFYTIEAGDYHASKKMLMIK